MSLADRLSPPALVSPPRRPEDPPIGLELEWLETDGRGGYAASTPSLCPTRRYHGLLVAPFDGTAERHVFLARFDEVLRPEAVVVDGRLLDGSALPLSVARYGDVWAPRGDRALESFSATPQPSATYRFGPTCLRREVRSVRGRHAVLVRYTLLEGPGPLTLELRPLLPYRRAGWLTVENDALDPAAVVDERGVRVRPYATMPELVLTCTHEAPFEAAPTWYRNVAFDVDRARGDEGREDEFSPGILRVHLKPGDPCTVAAALVERIDDPRAAWEREGARRRTAARALAESSDPLGARLERAADDFLYRATDGRLGVVAGYPWFGEWGRDTFIALPGLTLARGRVAECAEVLRGALGFLRGGLLPNVFGASVDDSQYHSADAALWFARAVLLYERAGGDQKLVKRELRPALESIAEAYLEGTELGIHVDDQGMLLFGGNGENATWMDARTHAGPVTPRHGSPVEIAALWCSLLGSLEELAGGRAEARRWRGHARTAAATFKARFWDDERQMLADVWCDGQRDLAVRPNAVLAAALELAPLTKPQRLAVVRLAEARLLTPRGLRTLAPGEPGYAGRYAGGPEERDAAYHQGTVWPWLLGSYVEASLRAARPTKKRLAELRELVDGLAPELDRAGLEHLSEVFDGDSPHAPGGAFAQAWNTAEWLRARRMLADGLPQ